VSSLPRGFPMVVELACTPCEITSASSAGPSLRLRATASALVPMSPGTGPLAEGRTPQPALNPKEDCHEYGCRHSRESSVSTSPAKNHR
jgi:hypothetical protein